MKTKNLIWILLMFVLLTQGVFATLKVDDVQFDPAIIAAGDEVSVIIQYHDEYTGSNNIREGNPEYDFKVWIRPDDTLSKKYLTFQDAEGEADGDIIFEGKYYNKVFKVKVNQDAPAGSYKLNVVGQWYRNGHIDGSEMSVDFYMPVKKEGIILNIANINTVPAEVRPGDDYVKLTANFENVGQKDAKSVELKLDLPEGIESSYSNDNRVWVGSVPAGQSKQVVFFVDVDDNLTSGVYNINYNFNFMDLDDNKYSKSETLPFLIKTRPNLIVTKSEGVAKAGETGEMRVYVKNVGEESAEAVDVRVLLQNSQPFGLDVRSDYLGELEPGEEGVAVFKLKVKPSAPEKLHSFKLSIRAKGDTDEGDDNIYVFSRRGQLEVSGKSTNWLLYGGLALLVIIAVVFFSKKKK